MNKKYLRPIAFVLTIVFPLSAFAQSQVNTPPIYIKPIDITAQQRFNRRDEADIKALIEQNKALAEALREQERIIEETLPPPSSAQAANGAHVRNEQMDKFQDILNNYHQQVVERDMALAERERQLKVLGARAVKTGPILDQSVDASFAVGQQRTVKPSAQLAQSVDQKNDLMADQYRILKEKSGQLEDFKQQLADIKVQLVQANERYKTAISEYKTKMKQTRGSNQIRALKKQLAQKAAAAKQLNGNLNAQNVKINTIQTSLKEKDDRLSQLDGVIAGKDKEIVDLKDQLTQAQQESAGLHDAMSANDRHVQEFKTQLAQAKDEVAVLKEKQDQLTQQTGMLADKEKEAAALKQELDAQKNTSAGSEQQIVFLKDQLARVQGEAAGLRKDIAAKDQDIETLKTQLAQVKDEAAGLHQTAAQTDAAMQITLKEKQDQLTQQTGMLADKEKEAAALKEELDTQKTTSAGNEQQMTALKDQLAHVQADAAGLRDAVTTKDKDIQAFKEQLAQVKDEAAETAALRQQLDEQKKQLSGRDGEMEALKDQLSRLKDRMAHMSDAVPAQQTVPAPVQAEQTPMVAAGTDQDQKVDAVQTGPIVVVATQPLMAKDNQTADLKAQIAKAIDETAQLRAELAKDDRAFARIRQDGVILKNKIREQEELLADKDHSIAGIKSQFADAKSAADAQAARMADVQQAMEAKNKELSDLQEQIRQMQQGLQDKDGLAAQNTALQNTNKNLQDTNQSLQSTLAAAQVRMHLWEVLAARHRTHIGLLEQKGHLLAGQTEEARRQADDFKDKLTKTVDGWKEQNEEHEQSKSTLQQTVENERQQIASLQSSLTALQNTVAAKERERQDTYHMLDRFKARLKENTDTNDEKSRDVQMYRTQIDQLDQDLRKAKDDVQVKQTAIDELHQDMDRLKTQADDERQQSQAKDLSLTTLQSVMDGRNKAHEAEVAQLKEQIKDSGEQLAHLNDQLTDAQTKLQQAQRNDELVRVQDMLKSSREEITVLNGLIQKRDRQIGDLQKNLNANSQEGTQQNTDLNNLRSQLDKQQVNMAKIKDDLQWKDKEITRLKIQLKDSNAATVQASHGGTVQIAELNARLKTTEEKLKKAMARNDRQQYKEALADAREEIAALKDKLKGNARQSIKDRQEHIDALTAQSAQQAAQIKLLMAKIQNLERTPKQDGKLKEQIERLRAQLEERQGQIKQLEGELDDARQQSKNIVADARQKDRRSDDLLREANQQKEQARVLEDRIAALQDKLKQKNNLHKDAKPAPADLSIRQQVKSLQADLDARQQRIREVEAQLTAKLRVIDVQQKQIQALQEELKAAREQLASLVRRIRVTEKSTTYGPGNVGYLLHEGKDTSTMAAQVTETVKTTETTMDQEARANEDYKAKYQSALMEIQDLKRSLDKCRGALANPYFSLSK